MCYKGQFLRIGEFEITLRNYKPTYAAKARTRIQHETKIWIN